MRQTSQAAAFGVLVACLGLPLAGAALAGRDLRPLWRFPPPLVIPRDHPAFSWIAAGMVLAVSGVIAGGWFRGRGATRRRRGRPTAVEASAPRLATRERRPFPWWGWGAIIWTLLWWWLAWTRQPWFAWGQRYTFTPLWLGLILIANALAMGRGGAALMTRAPAEWLKLFAASAAFWWVFEWLNRFVHNWHYLGAAGVGAGEYAVHATTCFSTVLPAVAGVREWLGTMPRLQARLQNGPAWSWMVSRRTAAVAVAAGAAGLVLTGAQPLYFYPALWAAPLLIGVGWSVLAGAGGWWREAAAGDWRDGGSWALAALACGFFWELWNWHSLAKWIYTVPFVQRWPVFEMPVLGYTGYLTFGLECALAAGWVLDSRAAAAAGLRPTGTVHPDERPQ
jgi:hypothetical protein